MKWKPSRSSATVALAAIRQNRLATIGIKSSVADPGDFCLVCFGPEMKFYPIKKVIKNPLLIVYLL
jgi:hypothetical protein